MTSDECTCYNRSCPVNCAADHSHKQFSCDKCKYFELIDAIKMRAGCYEDVVNGDCTPFDSKSFWMGVEIAIDVITEGEYEI